MNEVPILSIITPIYNGEIFINRCYQNLFLQTFTDWEWVVVDDGSTDGTVDAIKKINDNRINLFSYKTNKGRGFARTKAVNESRGDWIVIWDVDDMYFPDRLAKINNARIEGYDFFCSYAVVVDNNFNIKGIRGFMPASNGLPKSFVHPTMACRTAISKEIGYKSTIRTGEDAKILWTLSIKYKGMFFEDALTIYFEEADINLKKAIHSNLSQLSQLKELYMENVLVGVKNYFLLYMKYLFKLMALNIMRICPSFYPILLNLRAYGETKPDWSLSKERVDFIKHLCISR